MSFDAGRVAAALDAIDRDWRAGGTCVALSGGLDSTVLLHAMSVLARAGNFSLRALHVDHGLEATSRDWAEGCGRFCAELGIPLTVLRLGLAPRPGESVEAAARDARYAANLSGDRLNRVAIATLRDIRDAFDEPGHSRRLSAMSAASQK